MIEARPFPGPAAPLSRNCPPPPLTLSPLRHGSRGCGKKPRLPPTLFHLPSSLPGEVLAACPGKGRAIFHPAPLPTLDSPACSIYSYFPPENNNSFPLPLPHTKSRFFVDFRVEKSAHC